ELALEWLHARMRAREHGSTALVITAAVGKAGVGKTTLAVHAAHQMRTLFPDGQLYVNLRGVEARRPWTRSMCSAVSCAPSAWRGNPFPMMLMSGWTCTAR